MNLDTEYLAKYLDAGDETMSSALISHVPTAVEGTFPRQVIQPELRPL
jgi:hypothetical protein